MQRQVENLQDKIDLIRGDRDEKDGQLKKLKKSNEDLKKKLKEIEMKNDQMTLKIEQSFSSVQPGPNDGGNHHGKPLTAISELGGHQLIGGKPHYNSIDIGYDEQNFDTSNKNSKTNTHLNSQKKMGADVLR
mmetsp:Transcript_19889/g.30643  ORF Transcript_19889/g.30643 Transcript_19889/m.30643 type:complete len:132 (-) Transcript_19889:866-1261(-)